MIREAVIIAGGKGTRVSKLFPDIPKPLIPIDGVPIIERQILQMKKYGVEKFYITIGYKGDLIKNYLKDGSKLEIDIEYLEEKEPLGTAGAFFYLRDKITEDFIISMGDLVYDVSWKRAFEYHRRVSADLTLFVHPNDHPWDSDIAIVDKTGRVIGWLPKNLERKKPYRNIVNSGLYIATPKIFEFIEKPVKIDLEKDVVFSNLDKMRVYGYRTSEYIKDVGTPERYEKVKIDINRNIVSKKNLDNPQRAIFLDRDGTLNKYKGFITDWREIELEKGVVEGLKQINRSEYLAIVVTNQAVVAFGKCSEEDVDMMHARLETLLGKEGVYVDDIFYCPHYPERGYPGERVEYKIDCECRKPKTGLLAKAAEKYNIDLKKSWLIGDSTVDIQTAKNAGIKSILVLTGLKGTDGKYNVKPDYIASNLKEAVGIALKIK